MKASTLLRFLDGLGSSFSAIGVPQKSLDDLHAITELLKPFKDLDLAQLADFFKRAADYRSSEKLPVMSVPALEDITHLACRVSEAVQALDGAETAQVRDREEQVTKTKEQLQNALKQVGEHFGFTLTVKENKKWLPNLSKKALEKHNAALAAEAEKQATAAARATITAAVTAFQQLRPQITTYEAYQSEPVVTAVNDLATTDTKVLKAAASELGTEGKGKGVNLVQSILVKLTGVDVKPPKPPKKSKTPTSVVPDAPTEQVDAMVKVLQEMIEKTKDPDAVPDSEIENVLTQVGAKFSDAQQKEIAKRVTGKSGRSAEGAREKLREDLTAVKRALESQKV
jgi:hypothetical protein